MHARLSLPQPVAHMLLPMHAAAGRRRLPCSLNTYAWALYCHDHPCNCYLCQRTSHAQRRVRLHRHNQTCPTPSCSADLEERYLMTRALLDAGADVPWSAVRRTRAAAEGLTAACGQARLFQLRRLHEQTQAWDDTRGGTCAGAGAAPALELGRASFGGYEWRAALVCCMEPPAAEGGQEPGEDGSAAGAGPRQDADRLATSRAAAMSVPWRLGLRIAASPLLGRRASMDAAPAGPQHDSEGGHAGGGAVVGGAALAELLAIGATKAAAAVGRHFPPDAPAADAPAGAAFPEELAVAALGAAVPAGAACGTREGGGARHSACQAFDVVAGVCVEVAERQEQLAEPAGGGGRAFAPLLLALSCAGAAGGAWCLRAAGRAGARGCGLCRSGVVGDALAAAGGGDAAVTAFAEWQPERWSALAPAGQLHWRCGLRLLTDY